jgi:hypothetical protein
MPVPRCVGAGSKSLKVFGFAQFGEPVTVAGGKLRATIDDAFHKFAQGEEPVKFCNLILPLE